MVTERRPEDELDASVQSPMKEEVDAAQILRAFGATFASAALAFLSEAVESSPTQLHVLKFIIDRATEETINKEIEYPQPMKGLSQDELQLVLVTAFQVVACQLSAMDLSTLESERWLQWAKQLVDGLWSSAGTATERTFVWKELLCRRWDGEAAGLALVMLQQLGHQDATTANTRTDEIAQVIAFSYAHLPSALKEFCLKQVAALVSTFVDEGPTYQFSRRMILRLQLLEHLTGARFLDDSDDVDVTLWIYEFFPACFECCSVALQLLDGQDKSLHSDADDSVGLVRMLDMCLLVLKAGFDYFESRRKDIGVLMKLLSPVVLGTLSKLTHRSPISLDIWTKSSSATSEVRSLETSLCLLAKMGDAIESSDCDALTMVFDSIFSVHGTATSLSKNRPKLLSAGFNAFDQILAHAEVAESLGSSVNHLLQTGELKGLYEQFVAARRSRSEEILDTEMASQSSSIHSAQHNFPDEEGLAVPNAEAVASLLSGIDLDDERHQSKINFESSSGYQIGAVAESVPDQPFNGVVRPDAPQWFDAEDSDDGCALEVNTDASLAIDKCSTANTQVQDMFTSTSVPQWFDDDEEDDEADIDLLPCALDDPSDLSALLGRASNQRTDHVRDDETASDDGSTNTEVMSWSDYSHRSSERSRSSSLASRPNSCGGGNPQGEMSTNALENSLASSGMSCSLRRRERLAPRWSKETKVQIGSVRDPSSERQLPSLARDKSGPTTDAATSWCSPRRTLQERGSGPSSARQVPTSAAALRGRAPHS